MSKKRRSILLSLVVVLLVGCSDRCPTREELEAVEQEAAECKERLETCLGQTAFSLVLEHDSYGMFAPFGNHFRNRDNSSIPYRSGVLVQLADFTEAGHHYTRIELDAQTGPAPAAIDRATVAWIDVECGATTATTTARPLHHDGAVMLAPFPGQPPCDPCDPADPCPCPSEHKLNDHMINGTILPITLWAPLTNAGGLRVDTQHFTQTHRHVKYIVSSSKPCEVRVWTDLTEVPGTNPVIYPSGTISKLTVKGTAAPQHGGTHSPPWEIGP